MDLIRTLLANKKSFLRTHLGALHKIISDLKKDLGGWWWAGVRRQKLKEIQIEIVIIICDAKLSIT
jgi:hypothetical protein